jgi:hypothetical protein
MCAKCSDKLEQKRDFFYVTRYGALNILRKLEQLGWINQNGVWNLWDDLKCGQSVLLPTGAKLFRDMSGNLGVYGYAFDQRDIDIYRQYQLEVL